MASGDRNLGSVESPYPYTERPGSDRVNRPIRGGFPRLPEPSRSRIKLRQRRPRYLPTRKHWTPLSRARKRCPTRGRWNTDGT